VVRLAEQLGLVETRTAALSRPSRIKLDQAWWASGDMPADARMRHKLVWRRGRAFVQVQPGRRVRLRPTPWGALWLADPPQGTEGPRKHLLEDYLATRVAGAHDVLASL